MKSAWTGRSLRLVFVLMLAGLGGCVAVGGYDDANGYYGQSTVGYGAGFYQPYGYNYGGWQSSYRLGPPWRGGFSRPGGYYARPGGPSYRPALQSRPIPSIPTYPRGGWSGRPHR